MKYNVENVIRQLQEAKKAGKTIVDEEELIRIIQPKINNIEQIIKFIDIGIKKIDKDIEIKKTSPEWIEYQKRLTFSEPELIKLHKRLTFSEIEKLTGISRPTLYKWKDKGIMIPTFNIGSKLFFNLEELRDTLIQIKQRKG